MVRFNSINLIQYHPEIGSTAWRKRRYDGEGFQACYVLKPIFSLGVCEIEGLRSRWIQIHFIDVSFWILGDFSSLSAKECSQWLSIVKCEFSFEEKTCDSKDFTLIHFIRYPWASIKSHCKTKLNPFGGTNAALRDGGVGWITVTGLWHKPIEPKT